LGVSVYAVSQEKANIGAKEGQSIPYMLTVEQWGTQYYPLLSKHWSKRGTINTIYVNSGTRGNSILSLGDNIEFHPCSTVNIYGIDCPSFAPMFT
jgi:hypothetical protein